MKKLNIDEAIRCWNDPKTTFTSSYICWRDHCRGYKPDFKSIKIENEIQVDMDSEDFHIDEISIDDFETENDGCVTIRHRDSMTQERVKIEELNDFIAKSLEF